jgi:hypothetical protein
LRHPSSRQQICLLKVGLKKSRRKKMWRGETYQVHMPWQPPELQYEQKFCECW